jgi:hypothetical protein
VDAAVVDVERVVVVVVVVIVLKKSLTSKKHVNSGYSFSLVAKCNYLLYIFN